MEIRTAGIMSPGDMGHAVGRALRSAGLRVITCLEGRSERTRARSAEAGLIAVADDEALVCESDVILSILPPANAVAMAERLAAAIRAAGTDPLYVDCNAIAPQTTQSICDLLGGAGARYVDGGIIGGPPASGGRPTRLYVSGPDAPSIAGLETPGLQVRVLGSSIGEASGLKMCYASLTKGLTALATEALAAACALGLDEPFRSELQESQGQMLAWIERAIPGMPPKAERWVGEMEEIAATFDAAGLPPELMLGAAKLYRFVSEAGPGEGTYDASSPGQTARGVAEQLVAHASL